MVRSCLPICRCSRIHITCESKDLDISREMKEGTMAHQRYPVDVSAYKLYEAIGEGVSATVYRALCIPFNEIVAIKVLDLDKCNDLDDIRREVQMMSLIDHPQVLRALCSFTTGYSLWVVMPYMGGGSCLHIMKSYYPQGFDEPLIATMLHGALMALDYLHTNGHIHRDVKAGNILLGSNGSIKLADFGVSACVFDTGDRHRTRNTFVGTPCWMAPEVVRLVPYYDFGVDIWSFGITALELAHGHAPLSNLPPNKIFASIMKDAPPCLDYKRDKKFSQSFKEMVSACLVKDPKKRPTAKKLLQHTFFRNAKTHDLIAWRILYGLPPLGERFQKLKEKEAALRGQNKTFPGDKEQLSQMCIKGVSAWNFNLEELKIQASLVEDNVERSSPDMTNLASTSGLSYEDKHDGASSLKGPPVSNPIQPLQPLKGINENHQMEINELDSLSKGSKIGFTNSDSGNSPTQVAQNVSAASILPNLQLMLLQIDTQREEIIKLMVKCVEQSCVNSIESADAVLSDIFQASTTSTPYASLENQVIHLQQRIGSLVSELQRQKAKNAQLESRLSFLGKKE